MKKAKQKKITNKKGSISNDIAIILFFAGACLIVMFILGFMILKHII